MINIVEKHILGKLGEIESSRYLRRKDYDILCANYRTHYGEIDICAMKDDILVFVEVKTRNKSTSINDPADYVDYQKQKKISLAANQFIRTLKYQGDYQFDIVEVLAQGENANEMKYEINHIEDAFASLV